MKKIALILVFCSQLGFSQQWHDIALFDIQGYLVTATAELPDKNQGEEWINTKYGVVNLVDGDFTTAWVEGEADEGVGQSIFISIPPECRTISILNGYGKSPSLFLQNNRVKRLKATCHIAINPVGYVSEIAQAFVVQQFPQEFYVDLLDVDSLQTFAFPISSIELAEFKEKVKAMYLEHYTEPIYQIATLLQLEIVSVYKSTKYNDTCISEIFFSDTYVADHRNRKHQNVKSIYTDPSNDGRVLIDTDSEKGIPILEDPESIFQVIEVSSNNHWATIISMPADMGNGRVETEYLILNTHLGKVMNSNIEKTSGVELFGPFFLNEKQSDIILEHSQGEIRLK